ncbi:hypothetical protein ACFSO0_04315 [Brevibacillus sp. GCM10020057]|uniref:hypothetical protein n=1 Tax=Brevibacillus sp. GCM10020057 TaxID=3317327 RepID=UPI003627D0D1
MVLHFLFFTIKIERNQPKPAQRIAAYERSRYLEQRAEAQALEAAQLMIRI